MTNAPTFFIRLHANVTLLKNIGNTSVTACKRLDENDISTTRCNEAITYTTPTNTRTKIMSPLSWYQARPGDEDQIFH
jgi:hypothetical protein